MHKLIKIDTNGENASKFSTNLELYDLISPAITFLVDDTSTIISAEEIDWKLTREYFKDGGNGHCIYFTSGWYKAAYEFTHLALKDEGDVLEYIYTLSDLCDTLAAMYKITSWKPNME